MTPNEQAARKWAEEHHPGWGDELKINAFLAGNSYATRWVPVEERLPEKRGYYLAGSLDKKIVIISYYDKEDQSFYDSGVTHWMPLPQPPKPAQ